MGNCGWQARARLLSTLLVSDAFFTKSQSLESPHEREAAQVVRRGLVSGHAAPTLPAIVRTVHAALIRRHSSPVVPPAQSSGATMLGGSGQPSRTLPGETAIQPAIRAASDVRGVRPG